MRGLALQMASGGRRLTVHCRYCRAVLPCPSAQMLTLWAWLNKDDAVREFYRAHTEHAEIPDDMPAVIAAFEFDDDEEEKEELPTMVNLLDMEQRRSSNV